MTWSGLFSQLLEILVALVLAPLVTGWVNQCRAWLQNKSAPSLLLQYRMLRKLFHKESVVAEHASQLFRTAPYIVFGCLAMASGIVHAVKLYPAGATTNSDSGVTDIRHCDAVLARMEAAGMPLLVHGEVTDADIDVFDRERVFIDRVLAPLVARFPGLRVVFEHITTREAAQFVSEAGPNIAATLTAHHLLMNRNAIFAGGVRPHHYCLPVLKRETHRQALVAAATSGSPKFFLGTDSAPHAQSTKETACGCAGCYTSHAGIELYAEAFEQAGALDRLEAFASFNGPDFYRLPRNTDRITLVRQAWPVPQSLPYLEADALVPLRAGESVAWRLAD